MQHFIKEYMTKTSYINALTKKNENDNSYYLLFPNVVFSKSCTIQNALDVII